MNVLIINTTFDFNSPNTICVKEVINELEKKGHKCRIETKYGTAYKTNSSGYVDIKENNFILRSKLGYRIAILLSYFTWPRVVFDSIRSFNKYVKQAINEERPDCLIAYCNSYESLLVASKMKRLYGNKFKYIAYFLDSILSGPCSTIMSLKRHDKLAIRAEYKVLSNADGIVMMKAAEKKYNYFSTDLKYFEKIKFLDLPLYIPKQINTVNRTNFPQEQFVLLFAGSMPFNIRNPHYLLDVLSKLSLKNVHAYFAGTSDYMEVLNQYTKSFPNIHYIGLLNHEQVLSYLQESDILVNIGNNLSGMVPCKIFEYMSIGKPILTTIKIDDDPSIIYYNRYGNCLVLNERCDVDLSVKQIEKYVQLVIENKVNTPIDSHSMYLNTPGAFVDYIEEQVTL